MAEILTIHYPSSHLRNEVLMYLKTKTSLQDMILMVAEQWSSILDAHLLASSRHATLAQKYRGWWKCIGCIIYATSHSSTRAVEIENACCQLLASLGWNQYREALTCHQPWWLIEFREAVRLNALQKGNCSLLEACSGIIFQFWCGWFSFPECTALTLHCSGTAIDE